MSDRVSEIQKAMLEDAEAFTLELQAWVNMKQAMDAWRVASQRRSEAQRRLHKLVMRAEKDGDK